MTSFFSGFLGKKPNANIKSPLDKRSDESAEAPLKQKVCVCKPKEINESSFKTISNIDQTPEGRLTICDGDDNSGIQICLPEFAQRIDTKTTIALTMYTNIYNEYTDKSIMSLSAIMDEIEMLYMFEDITPEFKGVFFIQDPATTDTVTHKILGAEKNIFVDGNNDINSLKDSIIGEEPHIEIVVLLMEKCNTNYDITDDSGILSLVESIVNKGFIGVDFKESNVCERINENKLLLIDTDKSMHLEITKQQAQIAKQYMILLFITELYETWLGIEVKSQQARYAKRFYKILGIMVRSYVTTYNTNEKEHFINLLTGIDEILSPIPGRTPIERLIYYMPVLTGAEKYDNILNAIKAQTLVRTDKEKYEYGGSVSVDNKDVIDAAVINMTGMFSDLNKLFTKPQKKGGRTKRKLHKNSKPRRNTKTKR